MQDSLFSLKLQLFIRLVGEYMTRPNTQVLSFSLNLSGFLWQYSNMNIIYKIDMKHILMSTLTRTMIYIEKLNKLSNNTNQNESFKTIVLIKTYK